MIINMIPKSIWVLNTMIALMSSTCVKDGVTIASPNDPDAIFIDKSVYAFIQYFEVSICIRFSIAEGLKEMQ